MLASDWSAYIINIRQGKKYPQLPADPPPEKTCLKASASQKVIQIASPEPLVTQIQSRSSSRNMKNRSKSEHDFKTQPNIQCLDTH